MKNLEKYSVQELDSKTLKETDGGIWLILGLIAVGVLIGWAQDAVDGTT